MKRPSVSSWLTSLVVSGCLSLLCVPMAWAQSANLTRAEVYRLQNIVDLLLQDQSPRPARIQDTLAPRDAMATGSRSRAELLFNEGSVARIGSNSVFRFVPGTRRYQLPDGSTRAETVLQLQQGVAMVVSPGGGEALDDGGLGGGDDGLAILASTVQISGAQATSGPYTVLLVVVTPEGGRFVALTDGSVVSDLAGNNKLPLKGGQMVTVTDGVFGPVESFDLRQLYRTSQLTSGLGPEEEAALAMEPEGVQETLRRARQNTLSAIAAQDTTLQGLCTLDARGGDSTLSSNCVTTGADEPLSEFEDQREDSTPEDIPTPTDPRPDPGPNNQVPDQGPNTQGQGQNTQGQGPNN